MEPMVWPKTLYLHGRCLFLTWKYEYRQYENRYFNDALWHCLEEWTVFVGLRTSGDKWFGYDNFNYDGHTFTTITFAGIVFGKTNTYDARPFDAYPVTP